MRHRRLGAQPRHVAALALRVALAALVATLVPGPGRAHTVAPSAFRAPLEQPRHGLRQAQAVGQGDEGVGLFIITSGKVEVRKKTDDGRELAIATHTTGEFIGEFSVLDGAKRTANVVALEKTECIVLVSWDFLSIMIQCKLFPITSPKSLILILH